jgi:serine/threonine protein phosphatase PrpC
MRQGVVTSNVAGLTDVGMVRKNNEDNLIMADLTAGSRLPEHCELHYALEDNALLMVVSDGMGGAECGEVASELTVASINDALLRLPRSISAYDRLVAAVEQANKVVWTEGSASPGKKGMGATVTAALVDGDQAFIAEVGDSRAYLIRNGNIKQVTTDQSFVAQLIARGIIKPEDAVQHPRKNVILQSIGTQEIVQVAVSMFQIKQGDRLLICSDGLSNLVHTGEMLYFCETMTPAEACRRLIDVAKERGGQDNITVIIAQFQGDALEISREGKGLTGMLQTLSSYNPDQEAEKTHKRTQLLGNAALANHNYSLTESKAQMQIVQTLAVFPNSGVIKNECERLLEWLEYCRQVLEIKTDQIDEAAKWLEAQGIYFIKMPDAVDQIKFGIDQIASAKVAIAELMQYFENKDPEK